MVKEYERNKQRNLSKMSKIRKTDLTINKKRLNNSLWINKRVLSRSKCRGDTMKKRTIRAIKESNILPLCYKLQKQIYCRSVRKDPLKPIFVTRAERALRMITRPLESSVVSETNEMKTVEPRRNRVVSTKTAWKGVRSNAILRETRDKGVKEKGRETREKKGNTKVAAFE